MQNKEPNKPVCIITHAREGPDAAKAPNKKFPIVPSPLVSVVNMSACRFVHKKNGSGANRYINITMSG